MDKEVQDKIDEQLMLLNREKAKKGIDWNGYEVYEPIKDISKVGVVTGLHLVILVKGDEVRISDSDECMEYFRYKAKVKRMQNKLKRRRKKRIEDIYNSD